MALTPEDVVNKRFQQTKFREGYDQDEVDDFLDEVVVELRRLISENDELRAENERLRSGAEGQPVAAFQEVEPEPVEQHVEQAATPQQFAAPVEEPAPETDEAASSQSLLVLARRLHDEHVAEGTRKRDELIAEGEATARRLVNEAENEARTTTERSEARAEELVGNAENRAHTLVNDAETKEREIISRLESTKQKLEERIEELRVFERDYRTNLRSYIESQLNDLNSTSELDSAPEQQ